MDAAHCGIPSMLRMHFACPSHVPEFAQPDPPRPVSSW